MKARALIGTVLGTCTLQRLIGQGGMGAVYLAQQSRPRRQVAVKVLLPMVPLDSYQLVAFLERFRRETDAVASLEHPNIIPVHEYGECDGLAYLVMPYISGGTLCDELEQNGAFSFEKVVSYLDQLAAALDFAHDRGVIHRDLKPANILLTPEGRLLLTDFGLVKITVEGENKRQSPLARLTGEGAPVGTPDYMAPEQVIGEGVDGRADLYSLGIILYQMVTGTTPFQGETPMQIATQHLQIPPPSPQMLRPDLPVAAEQVILRALAKRPADRYARAQELALAFRTALMGTGIQLGVGSSSLLNTATAARLFTPKSFLDPALQISSGAMPAVESPGGIGLPEKPTGILPSVSTTSGSLRATERSAGGLLSRTGKFPQVGTGSAGLLSMPTSNTSKATNATRTDELVAPPPTTPTSTGLPAMLPQTPTQMSPSATGTLPTLAQSATGALPVPKQGSNTVKLTNPMKVVQVPVAGQPGLYITGLLPAVSKANTNTLVIEPEVKAKKASKTWTKTTVVLALLIILFGSVATAWFIRNHPVQTTKNAIVYEATTLPSTPDARATAMANATATVQSNVILSDPLSTNIHNWLTSPPDVYAFKDGAYHIIDRGDNGRATVLQADPFVGTVGYTLTVEEIKGDDTSANNSFGMIMRFTQQTKNNKTTTSFYSFEIVNTKGGEYQFWKYDDSNGTNENPWAEIWHTPFGSEFHQGQGKQATNTIRILMNASKFTITVNGKKITTVEDNSLSGGTVGMLVNLNGTEVAFKDLLLTRS